MTESRDVLIVEDEPVVLKVAGMALAAQGIGFKTATDVETATPLLESSAFKVVVTDLKLPGASGFEILELAKSLSPPPQVIVITGYATIENALLSFQHGSFDFVPKPFDVEELTSAVTRALQFTAQPSIHAPADRFLLGHHSWARLDPDGSATLGAADTVAGLVGRLERIELPETGSNTFQGQSLCQVHCIDGPTHRVWAPLSGQIIMTNPEIAIDLELINRDPFGAGWLVQVIPTNLEKELPNLCQPRHSVANR